MKLRRKHWLGLALFICIAAAVAVWLAQRNRALAAAPIHAATCDVRAPQSLGMTVQDLLSRVPQLDSNDVNAFLLAQMSGGMQVQTSGDWLLYGRLDQEALKQWRRAATVGPPKRLLVSSSGGDEAVALQLAADLARWNTPVEVFGLCGSACANYLLPAARTARLSGVVLMHGSAHDCQERLGPWGAWFRLGPRGAAALREAAARQARFDAQHPQLRDLIRLSASSSRGDPTGQPHDWLLVPAAALQARLPQLEVTPDHSKRLAAFLSLHQQVPELGRVYAPAELTRP